MRHQAAILVSVFLTDFNELIVANCVVCSVFCDNPMSQPTMSQLDSLSQDLPKDLSAIATHVQAAAQSHQTDVLELLQLLRLLEDLHRDIRETLFQAALPDNRQALYGLLKDIELNGGWPYINRMRIKALMEQLTTEESETT